MPQNTGSIILMLFQIQSLTALVMPCLDVSAAQSTSPRPKQPHGGWGQGPVSAPPGAVPSRPALANGNESTRRSGPARPGQGPFSWRARLQALLPPSSPARCGNRDASSRRGRTAAVHRTEREGRRSAAAAALAARRAAGLRLARRPAAAVDARRRRRPGQAGRILPDQTARMDSQAAGGWRGHMDVRETTSVANDEDAHGHGGGCLHRQRQGRAQKT